MAGPKDPWKGIAGTDVRLEPGAARAAADLAAAALVAVERVQSQQTYIKKHTGLANHAGSGQLLADKFDDAAVKLEEILSAQVKILTSMGETFVWAGHLLEKQDKDSGAAFTRYKQAAQARADLPPVPPAGSTQVPKWPEERAPGFDAKYNLDKLSAASGSKPGADGKQGLDKRPTNPENPTGQAGEWFAAVSKSIDTAKVADQGAMWSWMSGVFGSAVDNLVTNLTRLKDRKMWQGHAIDSAITATDSYRADVSQLSNNMDVLGKNLNYAAGWLSITKGMLPPEWYAQTYNANPQRKQQILNYAIDGWERWYIPGMNHSNTAIPFLVDPDDPLKPNGDTPRTPGSPGPVTTPSRGGPQSDALKQTQLAADAQNRKLQQAQQQANAEYQRQMQQAALRQAAQQQAAQQQAAQQQAAQQQAEQQQAQQVAQQLQQAAQQGMQTAQQAVEQGMRSAQQAAQEAMAKGIQAAGLSGLPDALSGLGQDALKPGGGKGGGGAGAGAGPGTGPGSAAAQNAKLFPRATLGDSAAAVGRAGLATSGQGTPGSPGGMGPAGHGAGGQGQKEHKRPDYLDSVEYLEDALGDAPVVSKPVVEK
ncbi:hypothetical protein [Nocardia australiensis]|uniref:hypothetical protein n=1 Tax=Nocardia australiensis TaxID=2887191 RepID=UPI001D13A45E|nr:hypothetical protein [Nocardia australiensis]